MDTGINWSRISTAIEFYQRIGYRYVEAPWEVSECSIRATAPGGVPLIKGVSDYIVGSGEQAFLELLGANAQGGKMVCCTPCFRHEARYDNYRRPYFMKVELIDIHFKKSPPSWLKGSALSMLDSAKAFLSVEALNCHRVTRVDGSFDLVSPTGVEVGSYGVRDFGCWSYAYGTGLAEPRVSVALEEL